MATRMIRIDDELNQRLSEMAQRQHRSKSDLVRYMLRRQMALAVFRKRDAICSHWVSVPDIWRMRMSSEALRKMQQAIEFGKKTLPCCTPDEGSISVDGAGFPRRAPGRRIPPSLLLPVLPYLRQYLLLEFGVFYCLP